MKQLLRRTTLELRSAPEVPEVLLALDLPVYAARTFDLCQVDPNVLRLRTGTSLDAARQRTLKPSWPHTRKSYSGAKAPRKPCHLRSDLTSIELLAIMRALAMTWHALTPEMARSTRPSHRWLDETIIVNA
ncbi:hypothetical protein [Paenarthrobacter sp. A20]|uniref:hypothetical protein n=1 Tax=Paenarthrobacter sp. A20 TaxID=2817891 RepID=UPI00209DA130|nr:hypothetical protein [Paenarthrobacter sp. A20]MCP1415609.1 hypothetical protein [Paenarthrobacter sp. A20]